MKTAWFILTFVLLLLIYNSYLKWKFNRIRSNSKKRKGHVVQYKKEEGPMRNDYTKLHYPYVKIDFQNKASKTYKLRYASSSSKPFKIGENIDVFLHENELFYWKTFETGLSRFIPDFWPKNNN